ncbi:TatD family hydrolase [Lignipirellula cremea]|uniref:Putative deoxyribonuclease YcfH n=1 Tax=Lignipirellula cremea TaxID=2528010 RepID=A0A518DU84_9BACT|nr:TatD family hydrolase [Lignipirellula cremea]QDU95402.1 putative deoxyribonuclease YcfH [Lignipirellula cremea]
MLIDTHAHLDDAQFDVIRSEAVARAQAADVSHILCVGCTLDASRKCLALAEQIPALACAIGIQPNYVAEAAPGDWDAIAALARSGHPEIVALGETGLDRYWDHAPFDLQEDYFDRHLRLSQQTGLPFIVHMRDCGDDIVAMLETARSRGPLAGVMHSFTGDLPLAERCLDLGLYISFAGMVTFKKSAELRSVAAAIPDDRILVETDSPYLSPHPHRSQRPNEPALMAHTAACLAEERGVSLADFAALTTANAQRLFSRWRIG